jgi:thiamine-phosphate pyrophosphorylase
LRWKGFVIEAQPRRAARKQPTVRPIVCYVTDRKALGGRDVTADLLTKIRAAVAAGADLVQIRERDLAARDLLALAKAAMSNREGQARILINDRLDVALAAGAAGVHLGGESLPARDVIRWCRAGNAPSEFLIGVSCHNLEKAREAERARASYIFFGPVFDTPSKKSFGPPQGVDRLAELCRALQIPVVAIGGLNEENAAKCLDAGAAGIAAIRMFQESREPGALKRHIAQLRGGG